MDYRYRFKRGDPVVMISGQYAGYLGTVESAVFQRSLDYPDKHAPGYHVILGDGRVATVRWDQVETC